MEIHEVLSEQSLRYLYEQSNGKQNKLYYEYKKRVKKDNEVNAFNKAYKEFKKQVAREKLGEMNFCDFDDEKFDLICTGKWIANNQGIFKKVTNPLTYEVEEIEASRTELVPTEVYKNIDTCDIKVKLMYKYFDKWCSLIVDRSTLAISHKIVELSSKGLDVTTNNSKHIIDYLRDCLSYNDSEIIPLKSSCSRLGWVDDKFIPYTSDIIFDGEQEHKHIFSKIKTSGEREVWFNLVSELRESLYFKIQFSTSIVAPLISKLSLPSFIVHFFGLSGSGKTVGAAVASSVWGSGEAGGMWRSVNGTNNWLMDLTAFMNNLPVILDDIQDIKSDFHNYDKLVMQLCNGCERGRMKGSESQKTRTWKTTFIFTGEESLVKDNSGGGVYNRVVEVDISGKTVTPDTIGKDIIDLVSKNYGFMGKELIDIYCNNLDEIENKYNEIINHIRQNNNLSTGKQNICIAILMLGDWIATKYFFKNEKPLSYDDLKEFSFDATEVDPSERAYEYIREQISINISKFKGESNENWGKFKDGNILIGKNILMKLLKDGSFDFKAVKKTWADKEYIKRNKNGKFVHFVSSSGITMNCICLCLGYTEQEACETKKEDMPF